MPTPRENFMLTSGSSVFIVYSIELSHQSWSRIYRLVQNIRGGALLGIGEDDPVAFEHYPFKLTRTGSAESMEQAASLELGDLGEIIPNETDAAVFADTIRQPIAVVLREHSSANMAGDPLSEIRLEAGPVDRGPGGSKIALLAPSVNRGLTGLRADIVAFPQLLAYV